MSLLSLGAWSLSAVAAIAAGAAIAHVRINNAVEQSADMIQVPPWVTSRHIGDRQADPFLRAYNAKTGILGLPRREVIYYLALKDSAGRTLEANCQYKVSGVAPPARWWSLAAYDAQGRYFDTPEARSSVSMAQLGTAPGARFEVSVGPSPGGVAEKAWLPTTGDGALQLLLRLYLPANEVIEDPAGVTLPTLERVGCV